MKAKDLCRILNKSPNSEVVMRSDNFELNGAVVPVSSCYIVKLTPKTKTCKDAFDGTVFDNTILVPSDNEEGIHCLRLMA